MATFNIAAPDQGCTKNLKPRVLSAKFGDSYEQRAADGINNKLETWDLTFSLKTKAVVDSIEDFLSSRNGVTSFDWVTPEGKTKKFICREWKRVPYHDGDHSFSCQFEEVPL